MVLVSVTSFSQPASELTARLSFVDFDGASALDYMRDHDTIATEEMEHLFQAITEGIARPIQCLQKIA